MTITVFSPLPGAPIGPGMNVNVSSDFIGPLPLGSLWSLTVLNTATIEQVVASWTEDHQAGGGNFIHWGTRPGGRAGLASAAVNEGGPVSLTIDLIQAPSTVVDSVTQAQTWSPATNLTAVIQAQSQQTAGGFTSDDRALLQGISNSTTAQVLLDTLTSIELSNGPTSGPVSAFLPDSTWGILVRITALPPGFVTNTPDAYYFFPSLAVVRLFRGGDMWKRIPIHTPSKIISFVDESVVAAVTLAVAIQWILNLSVEVDFAPGAMGQVFKLRFP